jgi:hypothetical protein
LAVNMVSVLKLERPMPIELVAKSIWYDILVMKEDLKVGMHGIGNIDLPNIVTRLMSYPFLQKLVAAWMRILLTFFISNVSWVLANITSESFPFLPERQQKLRTQIVYNSLPKFLGRLLYAYLHPLLGADELSG